MSARYSTDGYLHCRIPTVDPDQVRICLLKIGAVMIENPDPDWNLTPKSVQWEQFFFTVQCSHWV